MGANEKQVGGAHYKKKIQPWDFITANEIPFLEGNAIKYIVRHREKGGRADLEKAIHYLQKALEVYYTLEATDPLARSKNCSWDAGQCLDRVIMWCSHCGQARCRLHSNIPLRDNPAPCDHDTRSKDSTMRVVREAK